MKITSTLIQRQAIALIAIASLQIPVFAADTNNCRGGQGTRRDGNGCVSSKETIYPQPLPTSQSKPKPKPKPKSKPATQDKDKFVPPNNGSPNAEHGTGTRI